MSPIAHTADRIPTDAVRQLVPTPGVGRRTAATTAMTLLLLVGGVVNPAVASQDDDDAIDIEYDGDEIRLEAAPNQTITGTTDLEPGAELRVRVQSSELAFFKSHKTTVASDGSFETTFDLSEVASPGDVTVTVSAENGSATESVPGRLVAPGTETGDDQIDLSSVTTVERGETANLTVTMPVGQTVAVRIGDEAQVNYELVVQVEDADDDGEVTLRFDTATAGTADPTVSVGGDDRFEIAEPETRLNDSLAPGNYDLSVARTLGGDPVSVGTLVIEDGPADGSDRTTDAHDASASNDFWSSTAPGIAGAVALIAGIASLVLYRK